MGVVEKEKLITGERVKVGDKVIGIASSGPHSNGYSLIRHIIDTNNVDLLEPFDKQTLGDVLLAPTRIYVKPLLHLMQHVDVHALAHITGGGLLENIPRVLPDKCRAFIESDLWELPPVFYWLQEMGKIEHHEMYRTFNCGIVMVVIVRPEDAELSVRKLGESGETAMVIGEIEACEDNPHTVVNYSR